MGHGPKLQRKFTVNCEGNYSRESQKKLQFQVRRPETPVVQRRNRAAGRIKLALFSMATTAERECVFAPRPSLPHTLHSVVPHIYF